MRIAKLPIYLKSSLIFTNRRFEMLKQLLLILGQINARIKFFKSFGQTGEDSILRHWLPEDKGIYVDVGAGKPIADSNTFFLYKKGWHGICIDPIYQNSRLHKFFRPKDLHLQNLIGPTNKETDFWEFSSYAFSTANKDVADKIINSGKIKLIKHSRIKEFPLSQIVPKVGPLEPSLLSIDVEGFELKVLESNDWERFCPRVICIEEWDLKIDSASEIYFYLSKKGYEWKGWTGLTSFYVHSKFLTEIKSSLHHR